ncbi:MAG: hypothetical protein IJY87_00280 [Bacilli bacterium]|nr:hypothetical protein [Bacilli bacterium]MBQ8901487.1 hypothetical protein [Bacilli bacterium]
MILRNNKGTERDFDILFEVEKNNKKYVIYKDRLTENIYGGRLEEDKLKVLDDSEFEFINNMIEKLKG